MAEQNTSAQECDALCASFQNKMTDDRRLCILVRKVMHGRGYALKCFCEVNDRDSLQMFEAINHQHVSAQGHTLKYTMYHIKVYVL